MLQLNWYWTWTTKSGWIKTTDDRPRRHCKWYFGLGYLYTDTINDRTFVGGIQWPEACWQKVEFLTSVIATKTLETDILRQEWSRRRKHTRYLGWQVRGRGLNTELQSKRKAFDVSYVSSSSVGLDITWRDEIVMSPWKGRYFIMNIAAPRGTCYRFLLWICLRRRGSVDFTPHKKMESVSRIVVQ
jgi:hypothetical protein